MKKTCLVLTILCLNFHFTFAQDHSHEDEDIFAYAHNATGALESYKLEESKYQYKYTTTKKVMDDLIQAKGVRSMAAPKLVMNNAERRVAWAKPSKAIIGLEEKAYDLCATFGKDSLNALAALLAHELTHYYEKHDWKNRFVKDFGGNNNSGNAGAEKLDIETQADFLGGFLAFMAGYNTLGIMPNFLEQVYNDYGFPDEITGYPSLTERQGMATRSLEKLAELIDVFETANYLIALEDYEGAKSYYDHILIKEKYQSREIYNNLGVTAALAASSYFSKSELKYFYPIELDITSRLQITRGDQFGAGEKEEIQQLLLEDAAKAFKTALSLDKDYVPAMLNLGCTYALMDNYFDAEYHAQKALRMGQKAGDAKVISDAYVLLGIIEAKQDQVETAQEWFEKAIDKENSLGTLNLTVLKDENLPNPKLPGMALAAPEKVDDILLDQLVNELHSGSLNPTKQVEINRKTLFALCEYPNSRVFINFLPFDEAYTFFHVTNSSYSGQTNLGISVGDSRDKVVSDDGYGAPQNLVSLTNGEFLFYQSRKIVFQIGEDNQVKGWAVFREQKKKDE